MALTDGTQRDDVLAFHEAMNLTIGNICDPALVDRELRAELIREEVTETIRAIERGDMLETIDGLGDSFYVVQGALVSFGWCFDSYVFPAGYRGLPSLEPLRFLRFSLQDVSARAQNAILLGTDISVVMANVGALADMLRTAVTRLRVDLRPFWEEIQRANMAKVGGPIREDGKRLKPAGWTPPDHKTIFEKLYGSVGCYDLEPMDAARRLTKDV